ncbi:hypothetical protein CVT26_010540 [Gymnopilus dilepis]|uniref:Uncharacterized protein n=1 Tax=Gymnopilus dilepis TaxID=231916 RepID=A0A409VZB3_9AGAR|nr:hypothetical protein CVT26_010540 [Gymnopilus dilepis]
MAASVEQKKRQYSNQLAAYTLRQWNAVRKEPASQDKPPEQQKDSQGRKNENSPNGRASSESPETAQPNRKGA